MKYRVLAVGLVALLSFGLTACGGGSSSSPAAGVASSSSSSIASSSSSSSTSSSSSSSSTAAIAVANTQASADALVAAAIDSTKDLAQADNLSGLPAGSQFFSLPSGTTVTGTPIQCSSLGTSGSGDISYTYTINGTTPVSFTYSYNNCTWTSGTYTVAYNGTGSLVYSNYVSATNYQFTFTWNLSYSVTSGSYSSSATVNSSETCTINGSSESCSYNVGNSVINGNYVVTVNGSVTTVTSATVTTRTATVVFNNWVYNSSLGYATSGTVTVTDANGNSATITAIGTGYNVVMHINGITYNYTVSFT